MENIEFINLYHPEPLLIIISGPSGVGKDTVIRRLLERQLPIRFVVTATSRPPRPEEIDGVDYTFLSLEEFMEKVRQGEFFEYARVYNDYKGVLRQPLVDAFTSGDDVVMRVDVQGAATLRRKCPEAVLIFLTTRDEAELIRRLKDRKSDTPEQLVERIKSARQEMQAAVNFDYVVVNADNRLEEAVDVIEAIIISEHHRVHHRKVTI